MLLVAAARNNQEFRSRPGCRTRRQSCQHSVVRRATVLQPNQRLVVDTHESKEEQQRERPELPTRSAKLTNYLAIRWQRAPNLQVFTLHSTPSRSLTLLVQRIGWEGSEGDEGWWISSGGSCRDKRASTEVAKKSSKQCKPGKSLISRKETRKQTGNERRKRKKTQIERSVPFRDRPNPRCRTNETILIGWQ